MRCQLLRAGRWHRQGTGGARRSPGRTLVRLGTWSRAGTRGCRCIFSSDSAPFALPSAHVTQAPAARADGSTSRFLHSLA